MRLDLTLVLYWSSLGISAAAVVLFLWLMRSGDRKASGERREARITKAENEPPDHS